VNPLALSLALLLGRSDPAAPPQLPPAEAEAAVPAADPDPAPAPAAPRPALRELRLTRLPGDRFSATLGGEPVEGADFYRAALRPDLAERLEARDQARAFALIAAGAAAVGGPAIGWLVFHSRRREVPGCGAPSDGAACQALAGQIRTSNRADEQRGLVAGGAAGAAVAGLALWWWVANPPLATGLGEAEALVEAYQARRQGAAAPAPPARPAKPGDGETGLRLRLVPLAGGLLASAEWLQ